MKIERNKIISKLLDYTRPGKLKNDRQIIVFAICVLIATVLWFLNALEKDYSSTLTYSVKYVNPPEELFLANTPPSKLELNVQAHGFTLLRHKLAFSFSPIVIDLTEIRNNMENGGNTVRMSTENLVKLANNQVSKEISVVDVSPQTISLIFDSLATKSVSVLPQVTSGFKPQFYQKGEISVKPESLLISGPSAILDTIYSLHTELKTFSGLDATVESRVRVVHPDNIKISPNEVLLHIPVEKFTEKELSLPVQVINMPEGLGLKLFPAQISVLFLVGLSDYENISPTDFRVVVDYQKISSGHETLDVAIDVKPPFIQLLKVSPEEVEFLIETE
ncbi:hypothetical protein D1164_15100 [Mariniphaga sediminis]|uniref:YbbR-like domain-containing protein n=1 Tax=Mariniphaga sediminis TaxID=1628158 RepID=A0A399CXE8_9BACT|nr:CdaR family protein [Mariniphaga sediminis]RIH64415.1 hypothetical protein D1164_15100 [Mariniphaga sediminis]